MTQKTMIAEVRLLGLVCRMTGYGDEIKIDYRQDDPRYVAGDEGTSYFTNDRRDAVLTAVHMAKGGK